MRFKSGDFRLPIERTVSKMNNTFLKYVTLALVGAAFVVVSVLIIFLGDRPELIRKKLRLGALIIAINGVAVGAGCSSCYDPVSSQDTYDTEMYFDQDAGQIDTDDTATDTATSVLN
jgi:hypothetical protein